MKRVLLALVITLTLPASAQTVQQVFGRAVRLYEQGKYAESAKVLAPMVTTFKRRDGAVLYDLAAVEFKNNHPGKALFYLLQAQRSSVPEVRETAEAGAQRVRLYLTRRQAMQKSAMQRYLFQPYHDYMTMAFGWVNPAVALWTGLGGWFLGLIFLSLFRLGRSKSITGKAAAALLAVAVVSGALYAGKRHLVHNYTMGVIARDTGLFNTLENMEAQVRLPEGLEVRVIRYAGTMVKIRLVGGKEGFVSVDSLLVVPPTTRRLSPG